MALIELDLNAQPGPAPTTLPPARRYRTAGLALALALGLALGGAAAPDALRWQFLGAIALPAVPESPFQVDGDRLFAASGLGDRRTVTAWRLAKPPVKLWSVRVPARVVGPGQVAYGDVRAARAGDVVLITDGPDTTAVDARTGASRWHAGMAVHPMAGATVGIEQEPRFRPSTEYDQSGGAPGELYFSATGVPHDQPPVKTELHGVDLHTGATRWTTSVPGSVVVFDHPSGVLVLESGRLTLLAPATGQVLRTVVLPRLDGQTPQSGRLVGDLALISYGADDGAARSLVAFSVRTFRQLWRTPQTDTSAERGACFGLACASQAAGLSVLDPATGRVLWHAEDADLARAGADVLEQETGTSDALRVADPRNGDEKLPLAGWETDTTTSGDGPILLRRPDGSRASVFAVVEDDPVALRPLGATHGAVGDCAADDSFVVCRGSGALQVFSYRV